MVSDIIAGTRYVHAHVRDHVHRGCDLVLMLSGPISSEGEGRLLASMRSYVSPPQIDMMTVPPLTRFDTPHLLIDVKAPPPIFYFL
jgi:hypothetical protein